MLCFVKLTSKDFNRHCSSLDSYRSVCPSVSPYVAL